MKNSLAVILLGPPGSGKGTQAKMIEEKFDLEYVGSGNLLRNRIKKNDYTGKKIAEIMNQGKRVPTPVIFKLWMDKFQEIKEKKSFKGIIIDGSPRTVYEAKMLEEALEWYGWHKNKKVFFIKLSKKEVIVRLKKRKICQNCGAVASGQEKNCLKCNSQLVSRKDDTLQGINMRWEWYKREVMPTVRFYEKKEKFFVINGNQTIEKVFKDILKKIY